MKVFISGKISGDERYREKFGEAEAKLAETGHSVMNPARLAAYPGFGWEDYMHVCRAMQDRCDAILMLGDWQESRGAKIEHDRAISLMQSVYYSMDDIREACSE